MGFKLFVDAPKDLVIDSNSSINIKIMNFLSIDCSTNTGSLFLKLENKTFNKILQSDKYSNDLLMKQTLDFLHKNNLSLEDITEVLVNQGPGNFSGLRGAISICKGICLAKNIKLFGYNTFLWSCAKFYNKNEYIYSIIKFREKYFVKKFSTNLTSIHKAEEINEEVIIKKYVSEFKVITKSASKYFDNEILKLNNLNIVDLDHNELELLKLKGLLDKNLVKPLYLS